MNEDTLSITVFTVNLKCFCIRESNGEKKIWRHYHNDKFLYF